MSLRIPVGRDNFESIIRSGSYYVDKTGLIYELITETDNQVTLFTRPRRFGKTLTMSMLESFFDINRRSQDLFAGLKITKHKSFCEDWMNQYPVLSISFKDVEGLCFEEAYDALKTMIADMCKRHVYLLDSEAIDQDDKDIFYALKAGKGEREYVRQSIKTVMRMMYVYYGRPVILLIDEYDVPLGKAAEKSVVNSTYYLQMLELLRGILSISLKSNDYLKFSVVSGCLKIAKESIFTGVNNFKSYSVLDNQFSAYFGFTTEEVEALLDKAGLAERLGLVTSWYDGYLFGNAKVFCPWDVVNYVADAAADSEAHPENYWKNTSGNGIIRSFVERKDFDVSDKFETLLNGGAIVETVSDELTYETLHESEQHLWSVLLMTGYLTKADPKGKGDTLSLRIPNIEIASIFQDTVVRFFSDHVDKKLQRTLMEALWSGNEAVASETITDFLWQTISYMDYSEDYYHAFLAGIFVGFGYSIESNKESGLGRPDIKLTDKVNRRVLVIEAKRSRSAAQMPQDCEAALRQIEEQEYAKNLQDYRVFCYGIAFFQKKALVKCFHE